MVAHPLTVPWCLLSQTPRCYPDIYLPGLPQNRPSERFQQNKTFRRKWFKQVIAAQKGYCFQSFRLFQEPCWDPWLVPLQPRHRPPLIQTSPAPWWLSTDGAAATLLMKELPKDGKHMPWGRQWTATELRYLQPRAVQRRPPELQNEPPEKRIHYLWHVFGYSG